MNFDGLISGPLWNIGTGFAPLEQIPIIGIFFWIFDFILGFMAARLDSLGLK